MYDYLGHGFHTLAALWGKILSSLWQSFECVCFVSLGALDVKMFENHCPKQP